MTGSLAGYAAWRSLRESEDARYLGLAMPRFLARTPHGYHDLPTVARDLARGGFERPPSTATVSARSRAEQPPP